MFIQIEGNDTQRWPLHGWLGLVLVGIFWFLNWSLSGLRTHWGFFPLWLGYILTTDALVCYLRRGESLLKKHFKLFASLFIVSAPFWWLFELLDMRTQYWIYLGRDQLTDLQYFLFASLSFSTVIPAVTETARLLGSTSALRGLKRRWPVGKSRVFRWTLFAAGWLMLVIVFWKPQYGAAFVWMSIYCIIDPVNYYLGYKSLLHFTKRGDWRPVIALSVGCLICGFFWELWNFYSYPKWIYDVPFVDFWHLFEMPALGYLGYIPFSLEIYAIYHLVTGLYGMKETPVRLIENNM